MKFSLKRTLLPLALGASLLLAACGESEKERLQRELAELSAQVTANQQILDEQNSELASFEIRKAATIAAIAEAESLKAQLESAIAELEAIKYNKFEEQTAELNALVASIENKSAAVAALTTQVEQLNLQLAELQAMKDAEAAFFARAKVIEPTEANGAITVHKFKFKADGDTRTYVRVINWERELVIYHDRSSDAAMVRISFEELGEAPSAENGEWIEPTFQRFDGPDFNTGQIIDWDTGVILDYADDAGGDENSGLMLTTFAGQPEAYQDQLAEVEEELRASIEAAKSAEQATEDQTSEKDNDGDFILIFFAILWCVIILPRIFR
ncbi:MAG: hypothetical protein VX730_04230 [Pseudomonadota bacterium]|nr:hypothetical protein [Pseudomonadota bacterium]